MSARFRRLAARLWPDSLFGRLAMILFSGLVAAHVLAFVLIVLDRIAIEDEWGINLPLWTSRTSSLSSTTSSLKKDPPGSTASLDAIIDTFSATGESWKRSRPNDNKRTSHVCGPRWGPPTTRTLSTLDPPQRLRPGILMHLKDGSPLTLEIT